jgi:hypothetical protein
VLDFVKAKKEEHLASLDVEDKRNKFETTVIKWNKLQCMWGLQII